MQDRTFFALILLTVCLGCSFIVIQDKIASQKEDQRVLSEVAARLGVSPDWKNVREHVFCKMLQPGMTSEEVKNVLLQVGTFNSSEPPDQQIYFDNIYIHGALSPLFLIYDKNGLLKGLGVSEYNKGPRSSCEDEWMKRWTSPEK